MPSKTSILGSMGERIACGYLGEKGYKVIETNFRLKLGEIDIVTKFGPRTLIFVEVKTIHSLGRVAKSESCQDTTFGQVAEEEIRPEDHLTRGKLKRLKRICEAYLASHPKIRDSIEDWRIDLLGLTICEKSCLIKHFRNIDF